LCSSFDSAGWLAVSLETALRRRILLFLSESPVRSGREMTESLSVCGVAGPTALSSVASGLTRSRNETRSFCSSRKAIPTVTSGRIRLLRSRTRVRRTAGRGSSSASLSSADRLLPVLKGDEEREEGCR
jgi:hypothetical protein